MHKLEEQLGNQVSWVGAIHADHASHRHVHVIAIVNGRIGRADLQALTQEATLLCLEQRQERDLMREHLQQQQRQEEVGWEYQP
jgi:hypothetical protein